MEKVVNSPKVQKMFEDAERYIAFTKLKEYYDIIFEEIEEDSNGKEIVIDGKDNI